MSRLVRILILYVFVLLSIPGTETSGQNHRSDTNDEKIESTTITLTRGRYYRFEVDTIHPSVSVVLVKQWIFGEDFPPGLLESIQGNPNLKQSTLPLLAKQGGNLDTDSGYLRWKPQEGESRKVGALLWYLNGESKELVLYLDISLSHSLSENSPSLEASFDPLQVSADLKMSTILGVQYHQNRLPDQSTADTSIKVENNLHVSFSGSFSDQSGRSIEATDTLISGEMSKILNRLRQVQFSNESHHGITLGWLGYQHLRHSIVFLRRDGGMDFEYTVSGETFPLLLVRRQLQDNAWPLLLRGKEYVGLSEDGRHVFRPVECILARPVAKP